MSDSEAEDPLSSIKDNKEDDIPEPNVSGMSLQCQQCGERVTEAFYDGANQLLVWRCSQDHTSYIDEMVLNL